MTFQSHTSCDLCEQRPLSMQTPVHSVSWIGLGRRLNLPATITNDKDGYRRGRGRGGYSPVCWNYAIRRVQGSCLCMVFFPLKLSSSVPPFGSMYAMILPLTILVEKYRKKMGGVKFPSLISALNRYSVSENTYVCELIRVRRSRNPSLRPQTAADENHAQDRSVFRS